MRIKSSFWVKGYIRRCLGAGIPAAVLRHGDDDAGAIYVRINCLNGTSHLFSPAPAGLDDADADRRFVRCISPQAADDAAVEAFLERQVSFDADVWIVEIESRSGQHQLDDWLASDEQS